MNICRRIRRHRGMKDNYPFHKALRKYGFDNFRIEVEYFPDFSKNDLLDLEEELIKRFGCLVSDGKGYNVCSKGTDRTGYKTSDKTKKKLSDANKGQKGLVGDKNPMYGRTGELSPCYGRTGDKHPMYGITGDKHPSSKSVLQYTKDGIFIKEFSCVYEVERTLGINHSGISNCCSGYRNRKSAGGYIWKYATN